MPDRAPLSLERGPGGSVVGLTGGSSSSRRVDPRADLREATERNAREAREEREAAERRTAQAAKEQADAAAKARAEAAAAETEAEASHNRPPLLVVPLRAVAPDITVPPSEEVNRDPPAMERREYHVVFVEEAPQTAPTGAGQSGQSAAAPEQPAEKIQGLHGGDQAG